ncbi:MAG: DivIVA domain-containing protein [Desulfobulbaceae bacterium]|nr:DivIVA domain-containing protein [Desulfobulbaceae bacterium]
MTLTPQDIQSQQFHVRFRGFDTDEVDVFLEKIAEDFLEIIQENKLLKKKIESLTSDLHTFNDQDQSFKDAMISAQKVADEMKEKSAKEAEDLLTEARDQARQLRDEAHSEIAGLEKQVDDLKALREAVKSDVRNLLETYMTKLEESFEDLPPAISSSVMHTAADEPEPPPFENLSSYEEPEMEPESEEAPPAEEENDDDELPPTDISDLYTKIDLPDDMTTMPIEEEDASSEPAASLSMEPEDEADEASVSSIPDLEGDMIFSLEDPLDEVEPNISITGEEEKKEN